MRYVLYFCVLQFCALQFYAGWMVIWGVIFLADYWFFFCGSLSVVTWKFFFWKIFCVWHGCITTPTPTPGSKSSESQNSTSKKHLGHLSEAISLTVISDWFKPILNHLKHKAYEDIKGICWSMFSYHVPIGCRVPDLLCPSNEHSSSHLYRVVLCVPGSGMLAGRGDCR